MKNLSLLSFFVSLLMVSQIALAQNPVDISLSQDKISVFSGETGTIEMTIKNNQDISDTFSVSLFPSFLNKIGAFVETAGTNVRIEPKSSETVKLFFSVLLEAEETGLPSVFKVFATSTKDDDVTVNKSIQINVLRTTPVFISGLKLERSLFKPEETLNIEITLSNVGGAFSEQYLLRTTLKKDGQVVKAFDRTIENLPGKSSTKITESYTFGRYAAPGVYNIETSLKNKQNAVVSSKSTNIRVEEVFKLPTEYTEKEQNIGILSMGIEIRVKNEGNVPTPDFFVTESVPSFVNDLFDPEVEPTSRQKVDDRIIYSWAIPSLAPGQEVTIKYHFRLFNVWAGLLAIAAVIYYAFRFVFTPNIGKIVNVRGPLNKGREIIVTLEVKNRSLSEIKNIIIDDIVPELTQLVQRFDTVRPAIKKTSEGTKLMWKLDSLKPTEERILNYRIKPTVDIVGNLELPSARMSYLDSRKSKKDAVSRAVTVK